MGAKAQWEKVEGCSVDQCGPGEPQKNLAENNYSQARRRVTPRLCSKHPGSHAADHILHFILKTVGHKRNVNLRGVGNPGSENPAYFSVLDKDVSLTCVCQKGSLQVSPGNWPQFLPTPLSP